MISLIFQMLRWSVILTLAAAMTLATLLVRVQYHGDGRLQVGLKPRPGLEGTLVFPDGVAADPAGTGPAVPASRPPEAAGCAGTRAALGRAIEAYRVRTGRAMTSLDIFALLEAEVIHELPACPRGGAFHHGPGARLRCTLHGD